MVDYGEIHKIFAQQKGEQKYIIVLFRHMNTLKKFKKITKERQYKLFYKLDCNRQYKGRSN